MNFIDNSEKIGANKSGKIKVENVDLISGLDHLASFPKLSPDPIIEIDGSGKILYANPSAIKLFPDIESLGTDHPFLFNLKNIIKDIKDEKIKIQTLEIKIGDKWFFQQIFNVPKMKVVRIYGADITERKKVEDLMKESELRYRRLFESAKDGILILEFDSGLILDVNSFLIKLLDYSYEDFLEKHIWDIGVFKDVVASKKAFLELQRNEYIRYEDMPLSKKDGKKIAVEFVSNVYLVNSQKVIQCNVRDITERKKAEEALRESEERFRNVFEQTRLGIVIGDMKGRVIECNSALERMLGYDKGELREKLFSEFTHPDDVNLEESLIGELLAGKRNHYTIEKRYMRKNGETIWVHLTGSMFLGPGKEQQVGIVTIEDITERKKVEEMVRETSNYLESLLNYANSPIVVWNKDFKISKFNNAFELLTGRCKDEVIGKDLNVLFSDDKREEIMKHVKSTMIGERLEAVEIPILDVEGLERIILWNSANIYDGNGKITATIAQGQDITERKKAEETVEKSLKEKELLLREISHRVKNNLQLISSLLHLQQLESNKETASMLRDSQNRIKSIGLVHEILYKTKNFSQISVNYYLRELVKRILNTYDAKKISIEFDIDEIPLKINTAIPCGLIVNELLTNALKHAFPNNNGNVNLSFKRKNDKIEMTIADNGVGMPDNFSLENTKSLGLKLVKSLSEQLEGNLDYTVENGTMFKVTFPKS